MKILSVVLLIALGLACIVYARSQEVYLLPSEPGKQGKITPSTDKASVYWLIQYDEAISNYYLRGLLPGDTLGIFFEPPAACSLVEVHFCKCRYAEGDVPTYWGLVADVPDGITLDDYQEYHLSTSMPGPSPVGDIFAQGEFDFPYTGDWQWDTLAVPTTPDVGAEPFWAGTVIGDTTHSTRIDVNVFPPYHAVCWKQRGVAQAANGPGWYSSRHLFWVRALVKVYENIHPYITVDKLKGTYDTCDRLVNIYTEDFDPDTSTLGIDEIHLYYYINNSCAWLEADVIQDSVQYPAPGWEYGWWHAFIPGQPPETKVTYWVEGCDGGGFGCVMIEHWYKVKSGIPDYGLLYVERDDWFGPGTGVHNAFAGKSYDVWNEIFDGSPDFTVTDFYASGVGGKSFVWLAYRWDVLANFALTQSFRNFMDSGGRVFLSSQNIPFFTQGYPAWFADETNYPIGEYFKAYLGDDVWITESPFTVFVDTTDDLTSGIDYQLTVDITPLCYDTKVGIFEVLDSLCVPLFFDEEGNILGYRYEDPELGFKVVWLYFPFHAITDTVAQNTFIENLTNWFELGIEEEPGEVVYKPPLITPNPLSRTANISFTIPKNQQVSIKIYDVTGSLVNTLVSDRYNAGNHTLKINTDNLASGVYFLKMDAGEFSETEKFLIVK